MNPTIGETAAEDIHKDIPKGIRDFAVPIKGFELPKTADGMRASPYDFMYHDFYHAYVASFIPLKHREALFELACDVQEMIKNEKDPELKKYMTWAYDTIIDLEFTYYRPEAQSGQGFKEVDSAKLFWLAIILVESAVTNERPLKERRTKDVKAIKQTWAKSQFWTNLANKLKPRMQKWQSNYGINAASLKNNWNEMSQSTPAFMYQELKNHPFNQLQQVLCK